GREAKTYMRGHEGTTDERVHEGTSCEDLGLTRGGYLREDLKRRVSGTGDGLMDRETRYGYLRGRKARNWGRIGYESREPEGTRVGNVEVLEIREAEGARGEILRVRDSILRRREHEVTIGENLRALGENPKKRQTRTCEAICRDPRRREANTCGNEKRGLQWISCIDLRTLGTRETRNEKGIPEGMRSEDLRGLENLESFIPLEFTKKFGATCDTRSNRAISVDLMQLISSNKCLKYHYV
ncbi:hypothetical protein L9F63_025734, partial [Diploptera punctata]